MSNTQTGRGTPSLIDTVWTATHRATEPARQAALVSLGLYSVTGKLLAKTWKSLLAEGEQTRRKRGRRSDKKAATAEPER